MEQGLEYGAVPCLERVMGRSLHVIHAIFFLVIYRSMAVSRNGPHIEMSVAIVTAALLVFTRSEIELAQCPLLTTVARTALMPQCNDVTVAVLMVAGLRGQLGQGFVMNYAETSPARAPVHLQCQSMVEKIAMAQVQRS